MGVSSTANQYSKLGVETVVRWLDVPLPWLPLVACPGGGTLRIGLTGARLAEEGAAAGNIATVLVDLDSNGDGTADAADAQLAWLEVVPVRLFAAYVDQVAISVPIP